VTAPRQGINLLSVRLFLFRPCKGEITIMHTHTLHQRSWNSRMTAAMPRPTVDADAISSMVLRQPLFPSPCPMQSYFSSPIPIFIVVILLIHIVMTVDIEFVSSTVITLRSQHTALLL
jgi:hypothetical protein